MNRLRFSQLQGAKRRDGQAVGRCAKVLLFQGQRFRDKADLLK